MVSAHGATTYQQLLQQATTQAQQYQGMQQQGVVLTATSDVEFLVSYFAVHMAGAVAVLLPATATPQQVEQMQNALRSFTFPEGSADVLFTTGTTGTPKGAVISTQAIAATAENIIHAQAYHLHYSRSTQSFGLSLQGICHTGNGRHLPSNAQTRPQRVVCCLCRMQRYGCSSLSRTLVHTYAYPFWR